MYYITDKASYVRELQRLLNITETGKYDPSTKEKVNEIKRANGLSNDYEVDYETFEYILARYRKRQLLSGLGQYMLPIKRGDQGDNVLYVNALLSQLLVKYTQDVVQPKGSYFGKYSVEATRFLREIYLLDDLPYVDGELLKLMQTDLSSK